MWSLEEEMDAKLTIGCSLNESLSDKRHASRAWLFAASKSLNGPCRLRSQTMPRLDCFNKGVQHADDRKCV
jgi:hypothetical protein